MMIIVMILTFAKTQCSAGAVKRYTPGTKDFSDSPEYESHNPDWIYIWARLGLGTWTRVCQLE